MPIQQTDEFSTTTLVILMASAFCRPEDLCSPCLHQRCRQSGMGPPAAKSAIRMTRAVGAACKNEQDYGFALSPKIDVPTRTHVEPSWMATSKSCDIPIESTSMPIAESFREAIALRKSRNLRKYGRAPSGSSV